MSASNALFTVLLLKHVYNVQLKQSSVTKERAFRNVVDQITSQMSADITTQTHITIAMHTYTYKITTPHKQGLGQS